MFFCGPFEWGGWGYRWIFPAIMMAVMILICFFIMRRIHGSGGCMMGKRMTRDEKESPSK